MPKSQNKPLSKPKRTVEQAGSLIRHAASFTQKVDEARERMRGHEVSAELMEGKVRATVTCEGQVRRVQVEPSLLEDEGLEMMLDLVVTTINKAFEEADRAVDAEVTRATGGVRIPGISD